MLTRLPLALPLQPGAQGSWPGSGHCPPFPRPCAGGVCVCLGCGSAVLVSVCGRSAGERCPLPHGRRAVSVCRCVCVSGAGGQLGHTQAPRCGRELVSALCVPAGTGHVSRAQRVEDAVRAQGGVPPLGRRPLCPRPWATRGTAAGPALLAYGPWGQRTWPCGGAGSFSPGCAGLGGGPGGSPGGIQADQGAGAPAGQKQLVQAHCRVRGRP